MRSIKKETFFPKVAMVLLNFNCKKFIRQCISSIELQMYRGEIVIIIVDNASTDGSQNYIRHYFPHVTLLANTENEGTSKGLNRGIQYALQQKSDFIGLFNADIFLTKNWLKESLQTFFTHSSARVGICASLVLDWSGKTVESAGGTITNFSMGIFSGFLANTPFQKVPTQYLTKEFPVFFGIITAMLVRATTFKDAGFFDEEYFMCFEDSDFSWRVRSYGQIVLCNPRAIVRHFSHGSHPDKKLSLKLFNETEKNLLATYYKNISSKWLMHSVLSILIFARIGMSIVYFLISYEVALTKLRGIFSFIHNLLLSRYAKKRTFVNRGRKLKDFEILSANPASLWSIVNIFQNFFFWTRSIQRSLKNSDTT